MASRPIEYATYFDRHYLTRGLALYASLVRHSPPFVLRTLCLDDETYQTLARLRLDHLALTSLAELERADPALLEVKPTRHPVEYYWTCGPAFLSYLFDQQPEPGLLVYLDADLFFFSSPSPLYEELGDGSILLVEHRETPAVRQEMQGAGGVYNVGLVAFRRSRDALACLRRWREQCLEWCYFRREPDRFGDQKYLDEWPARYGGVVVTQHLGAGLAPWNVGNHALRLNGGGAQVDGHPLVFYHFNALRLIAPWLYDPCLWRAGTTLTPELRDYVYVPYLRELRVARRLVRAVGGPEPSIDNLLSGRGRLSLLAGMVRRRSMLVVTDRFAF
jgi:hypothetical protein